MSSYKRPLEDAGVNLPSRRPRTDSNDITLQADGKENVPATPVSQNNAVSAIVKAPPLSASTVHTTAYNDTAQQGSSYPVLQQASSNASSQPVGDRHAVSLSGTPDPGAHASVAGPGTYLPAGARDPQLMVSRAPTGAPHIQPPRLINQPAPGVCTKPGFFYPAAPHTTSLQPHPPNYIPPGPVPSLSVPWQQTAYHGHAAPFQPPTPLRIPNISGRLWQQLAVLSEPERTIKWFKCCFERCARSGGDEIVQAEAHRLYAWSFSKSPPLTPIEFTQAALAAFPDAESRSSLCWYMYTVPVFVGFRPRRRALDLNYDVYLATEQDRAAFIREEMLSGPHQVFLVTTEPKNGPFGKAAVILGLHQTFDGALERAVEYADQECLFDTVLTAEEQKLVDLDFDDARMCEEGYVAGADVKSRCYLRRGQLDGSTFRVSFPASAGENERQIVINREPIECETPEQHRF